MQLVVLVILVIIGSYLDKAVLHPGEDVHIKGKDILPDWLVATVIRYPDPELELVANIILN